MFGTLRDDVGHRRVIVWIPVGRTPPFRRLLAAELLWRAGQTAWNVFELRDGSRVEAGDRRRDAALACLFARLRRPLEPVRPPGRLGVRTLSLLRVQQMGGRQDAGEKNSRQCSAHRSVSSL